MSSLCNRYSLKRLLRGSDYYSSAVLDVPSTNSGPLKEEELVMGKLLHRLRLVQDMNAHPVWGVEPDPRDCSRVATHNIGEICHFFGTVNRLHRLL